MAFSRESLLRLLRRHPRKLRIRRRLLAAQRTRIASRFPEPSCKELHELCREIDGLERGLAGFLEQRVPSRAARSRLRALWRRVQQANAVQLEFAEAWQRGGVVDARCIEAVVRAIATERRDLRLFARDLLPRIRPRLVVVRRGSLRGLAGSAIAVRIDPRSRRPVELAYRHVAHFAAHGHALAYRGLYRSYRRALEQDCGLQLPWGAARIVERPGGGYEAYVVTERVPDAWLATRALRALPDAGALELARLLLGELEQVWRRPASPGDGGMQVAVSGQLDAWAVAGFDPEGPEIRGDERLVYLGAHLPLLLRGRRPLLDPQVVTPRIPWPLAVALEPLVQSELARPHQPRNAVIDAIASFESRSALQGPLVELANELIEGKLGRWIDRTLTLDDVRERQRRDDHLSRLLGSLDCAGGVLEAWRGRGAPGLVDAAFELYGILTRPRGTRPDRPTRA